MSRLALNASQPSGKTAQQQNRAELFQENRARCCAAIITVGFQRGRRKCGATPHEVLLDKESGRSLWA